MEVAEVVQWWEDWQLRILVLVSLFLQCFLFATAALRKRRIPAWIRVCIWLAYLGSDAAAIYALATLFNHQRKRQWMHTTTGKNTALQVLWAPVLLLHLGGQDGISSFSIEDNELWKRHVLTAASQITVAIYVFCKSLPEDIRVFQATILIFVPGILKCLEKPWALNKASIYSMSVGASCYKTINEAQDTEGSNNYSSLDDYVKDAVKYFRGGQEQGGGGHGDNPFLAGRVVKRPYKLFVDLSYSYGVRLENLKYMSQRSRDELRQDLYTRLFDTFDRFYTKKQVYSNTLRGRVVRIVALILTFTATVLFHTRREEAAGADTDVIITYVLLCCTVSMELISSASGWLIKPCFQRTTAGLLPWSDQVAQYNLIWYLTCRKNKQSRLLRWLAKLLGCKDRLDRLRCMDPCNDDGITELVHGHITTGWTSSITDTQTYRQFSDNRGQLALKSWRKLKRRVRRPFDESVLLWHLATDFCFYKTTPHPSPSMEDEATATRCRRMSNYMVYLLFVQPEMLIPGARYGLFKAAYRELRFGIMGDQVLPPGIGEKQLAERIIQQMKNPMPTRDDDGPRLVHEAWELAQELTSVRTKKGDKAMWTLIQGVWVEMLCFSAGRTRGYLHAKALGKGGEYLSYVWLLLWYMGMETFAVRLQRTGLQEEGDMSAPVLDPETSASAPKADSSITRRSQASTVLQSSPPPAPATAGDDAV